jgi:PmbA protein
MEKKFYSLVDKHKVQSELYFLEENIQDFTFKNGVFSGIKDKFIKGLSVRVVNEEGKMGFSSAANENVEDAFLQALNVAPYTTPIPLKFRNDIPGKLKKEYKSKYLSRSPQEWIELGQKVVNKLKEKIKDAAINCSIGVGDVRVKILNSAGLDKETKLEEAYLSLSLSGAYGDNIVNSYSARAVRNGEFNEEELVEKIVEEFLLAKKVVPFEAGKYPVIFAPTVMNSVLKSLQSGLSGNAIYKKLSPLTGKLGEKILSDKFSLQENYEDDESIGVTPFDDEGTKTQTGYIVENGVLKRYLIDLEHAGKLNMEPTGNAFRSSLMGGRDYQIMASSSFGNVKIMAGDVDEEEMFKGIKEGVYLKGSFDCWMGNILPGTLRGSLHLAYKIEDGKLVGRIKNRMFSGNFYQMFGKQLEAVGNKEKEAELSPGFYSPVLLVKDLSIV